MAEHSTEPRSFEGTRYWRKWLETLRFSRLDHIRLETGDWHTQRAAFRSVERPVFILGSPRSGTTYLGTLLATLPEATYFYEPPVMKYYARLVYEDRVELARTSRFYRRGFQSLLLAAPGSGPRVIEKNPNHTWIAETLLAVFPDAKFVMIIRDGRDTALSLSEKPWHRQDSQDSGRFEPGGYAYGPEPHFYIEPDRRTEFSTTSDIHRCAWIWRRHTQEIERLSHVLPMESRIEVRYEALLERPEETIGEILSFLGDDSPESSRAVLAASASGHRNSIGRWESQLTTDDIATIENECGATLARLGYH
jgi:hypothetical protein